MNYEQVETDILTRLAPLSGFDIEVVPLPENQNDFKRPFGKGKVTVGYKGSKWKMPSSTGEVSQLEIVTFEFGLQSRTLRGPVGIYTILNFVLVALIGFKPTNSEKMYAHEAGMTGVQGVFEDGVWTYTLLLSFNRINVEDFEEDLTLILRRITNNFPVTNDQVIVGS